jgi:hypothetical protein
MPSKHTCQYAPSAELTSPRVPRSSQHVLEVV